MTEQVAVVTGGARGIGAACADLLQAQGFAVAVLDLDTSGVTGRFAVHVDVTSSASVTSALTEVEQVLGPPSALVHAAGVSGPWTGVLDLDEKDWDHVLPAYSASKGAVVAFAKSVGKDLATTGVVVNVVTPAGVDTGMTHENPPEIVERMRAAVPMGRLARADEVAALVAWLAGPACSFSTGAVFDVSGGRSSY